MPVPFSGLFQGIRNALTQKRADNWTPDADPPSKVPPLSSATTPISAGNWTPDAEAPRLNPVALPDVARPNLALATPNFNPAESLSLPAAMASKPEQPPPHWYKNTPGKLVGGAPLQSAAEGDFLQERGMIRPKNNFSVKERLMEALKLGATGAFQGMAQTGSLQGALGGFAAGAGFGAYDPRVGARTRFSLTQEPQLIAQQQRQQQEASARAALEKEQIDNQHKQAQIGRIDLQNQMDQAEALRRALETEAKARREGFVNVAPGASLYDTNAKQSVFTAPGREKPMSMPDAEAEVTRQDGPVEKIARDSTEGQKEQIYASLPPQYRDWLTKGYSEVDVPAMDASGKSTRQRVTPSAEEMMAAQKAYNDAYDRTYKQNLEYTKGIAKQKAAQKRTGQAPKTGGATNTDVAPRNVNDLLQYLK
jgi:hypothetical protein